MYARDITIRFEKTDGEIAMTLSGYTITNDGVKLTGWIARDREFDSYYGTGLILFGEKPRKSYDCWNGDIVTQLPWELFSDLKWNDEPVEVEITIRKK